MCSVSNTERRSKSKKMFRKKNDQSAGRMQKGRRRRRKKERATFTLRQISMKKKGPIVTNYLFGSSQRTRFWLDRIILDSDANSMCVSRDFSRTHAYRALLTNVDFRCYRSYVNTSTSERSIARRRRLCAQHPYLRAFFPSTSATIRKENRTRKEPLRYAIVFQSCHTGYDLTTTMLHENEIRTPLASSSAFFGGKCQAARPVNLPATTLTRRTSLRARLEYVLVCDAYRYVIERICQLVVKP